MSTGWVVGGHEVEEVENRMLAAHANVVVASVDYRMAPEFKFPYAVDDCFDALKWVFPSTRFAHWILVLTLPSAKPTHPPSASIQRRSLWLEGALVATS